MVVLGGGVPASCVRGTSVGRTVRVPRNRPVLREGGGGAVWCGVVWCGVVWCGGMGWGGVGWSEVRWSGV